MNIYRTFDSSEFLFEKFWKHVPNILSNKSDPNTIINSLILSSKNFCDLKSQNKFQYQYLAEGGFGSISFIKMHNKPIKAAVFSIDGKNDNVYYVNIIIKSSKQTTMELSRVNSNTISFTDPFSEMIFGSALGHLYDLEICPFVSKYFGNYICRNNEISMIMEASNYEFLQKLDRRSNRFTLNEFKNILFQFLYCFYIMKLYYGTVHFDTHMRNIMVTDLSQQDYMYKGKYFSNIKYIIFETSFTDSSNLPILIVIPKTNYLLKLIDFGSLLMCFDRSHITRFKSNLRVRTSLVDLKNIGALDAVHNCLVNESYANTIDILYTLMSLYQYLEKNLDQQFYRESNRPYLNLLNSFSRALFNFNIDTFLVQHPEFLLRRFHNGSYDFFIRNHSTGLPKGFDNLDYILRGLIKLCDYDTSLKFFIEDNIYFGKKVKLLFYEKTDIRDMTSANTILLTHEANNTTKMFNRLEQLIDMEKGCQKTNSLDSNECKIEKLYSNQKSLEILDDAVQNVEDNSLYKIIFRQSSTNLNPKYKNYNSWFANTPIDNKKINTNIEDLRMFFIELKNFNNVIMTNSEYMTQEGGISIPVGHYAKFENSVEPLGICVNDETSRIFLHMYPSVYNNFLAIFSYDGRKLHLEKHDDFLARHYTTKKKTLLNENNEFEIVDTISPPIYLKNGGKYKWAVTMGPILVWEKKIVFTEEVMLNSTSKNKIHKNSSDKIFIGKDKGYFGMTDSNELTSHIILVKRQGKYGFLFIEGKRYLTVGLDRVSCAQLCANLDADYAVCVSSGLTSNILLDNKFLSKSPFRSRKGAILRFTL